MRRTISYFLKGILIGIGMLIPGMSGGTVAVTLNVFEEMVEAVSRIFSHFKQSISILTPLTLGALIAIYVSSKPIKVFCVNYPTLSEIIFCLIAFTGCYCFIKQKVGYILNFKKISLICFGGGLALGITIILNIFGFDLSNSGGFQVFLLGFPLSIALVLPAISFSYMLLFFGLYEKLLTSIEYVDISFLIPLISGVLVWGYLFTLVLSKLLKRYSNETYCFVLGFVVVSIANIIV